MGSGEEQTWINNLSSAFSNYSSVKFGKFIEEKLNELGITKNFLCKTIGIENKTLTGIINGTTQKVDIVTILKLGDFLQVNFNEFVERYLADLDVEEIHTIQNARNAGMLLRNFDLDALKKLGFLKSKADLESVEKRILKFFGLESLHEYEHSMIHLKSLFSSTNNSTSEKMLKFWCFTAQKEFREINNPYPFDIDKVKAIIARLSISTSDEVNGLYNVVRSLYHAGVTVIVNPYVGKTQVRGATFIVDDKPCIVLQDYRKYLNTIWFALAHELCHVVKDLEIIRLTNFHVTVKEGENDLFIDRTIEDRANKFASELLLPMNKLKYIVGYIDVPGMVKKYARKWQVSESIIYGQYAFHYRKQSYYSKAKKAEVAVKQLLMKNMFSEESIPAIVEKAKKIYN